MTTTQSPTPSASISRSVDSQESIWASDLVGNRDIAESSTSTSTPTRTETPFSPFSSLFHEIHAATRQTKPPHVHVRSRSLSASLLCDRELPAPTRSLSTSSLSQIELPGQSLYGDTSRPLPLRPLADDVSFILNASLTLNQSLEALSVARDGMGDLEAKPIEYPFYICKQMATRLTFKPLSSIFRGAIGFVEVGNVYLRLWSDWGRMHAGEALRIIFTFHPCLAWVFPIIVSSLLSLHPATLLYACLLYIREVAVMATEMDPELTIA